MNAFVKKVRHRLLETFRPSALTWDEHFRPMWVKSGHGFFEAGRRTYWAGDCSFFAWKPKDSITIGSYCSIASGVTLIAGGNHLVDSVSTYPFTMIDRWLAWDSEPQEAQHVVIGNDVWIGARAMVVGDVTVGHGAVIAAGSVVVHDVAPYAIVAGVPARQVRSRFNPTEIGRMLDLRWWDWPEDRILEAEPLLRGREVEALVQFARKHVSSGVPKVSERLEPADLTLA